MTVSKICRFNPDLSQSIPERARFASSLQLVIAVHDQTVFRNSESEASGFRVWVFSNGNSIRSVFRQGRAFSLTLTPRVISSIPGSKRGTIVVPRRKGLRPYRYGQQHNVLRQTVHPKACFSSTFFASCALGAVSLLRGRSSRESSSL